MLFLDLIFLSLEFKYNKYMLHQMKKTYILYTLKVNYGFYTL